MLDENRIKLMSRLASYEAGEGKKTIPIASYFRGDYVSLNVVGTVISVTVAYVVLAAAWLYYNMETMIADIYKMDLMQLFNMLLSRYLAVIAVFAVFSYFFYSFKYDKARKSLQAYLQALRRLSSSYEED